MFPFSCILSQSVGFSQSFMHGLGKLTVADAKKPRGCAASLIHAVYLRRNHIHYKTGVRLDDDNVVSNKHILIRAILRHDLDNG